MIQKLWHNFNADGLCRGDYTFCDRLQWNCRKADILFRPYVKIQPVIENTCTTYCPLYLGELVYMFQTDFAHPFLARVISTLHFPFLAQGDVSCLAQEP